jgi:alpha-1,3-rhamnosyl/mannosyltransferase
MNIAIETSSFLPKNGQIDGIGRYTKNIYDTIKKTEDLNVQGLCLPFEINKLKAISENHIIIDGLPFKRDFIKSMFLTSSYQKYFTEYDLLFCPDFYRIPIVKNIPMVATIHDSIPLSHPEWIYSSKILSQLNTFRLKYTANLLERVICISEFAAHDVMGHFGISENKIDIIYHGIDKKFFQTVDTEIKRSILDKYNLLSKKYILHVSTFQPRKNQMRILEAYERLPKNLKEEYPLVMIGKNGWGCDDVIKKLQQLETNNEVKWLNNITDDELFALYQESLCFVFPSLYEGFGFPILEAMASNTPVITSNIGAMKEIAGEGNAYLVDPYNTGEISYAMQELLTDSLLRNSLVISGRTHAEKFTWERSAKKHIEVFRKML